MNLKSLISQGTQTISRLYPESEAREMVLAYLCDTLGILRHTHILEPAYEVTQEQSDAAVKAFERMASGEPLQYVTGKAPFYGRTFHVTPATLIPRPETELLCRLAIQSIDRMRCRAGAGQCATGRPKILDLCTGSGCIAWTMALELPKSDVTAVDLSEGALEVASGQDFVEEISRTGASVPEFMKADVLAEPPAVLSSGSYDLILSNPPYVMDKEKSQMRPNVLDHEPHMALFVSDDDPHLFYRAVASWASSLLAPDGYGIVEINETLGPQTAEVFLSAGFTRVRVEKDLNDKDRFVTFAR